MIVMIVSADVRGAIIYVLLMVNGFAITIPKEKRSLKSSVAKNGDVRIKIVSD